VEIIPPTGWYYKPPSAVPVSYDRASIPDYGPKEFREFEGNRNGGYYKHNALQPHEMHPVKNMRFLSYGI
jgi:hypothetical protein